MPAPGTYIDLTGISFPHTETILVADYNAGTYSGGAAAEQWFKLVPSVNCVLGFQIDDNGGASVAPRGFVYQSDGSTLVKGNTGIGGWYTKPLTAGSTYWLRVASNPLTQPAENNFDVLVEQALFLSSVPAGALLINDDTAGFPATVWDPSDGSFQGFWKEVAGGEIGNTLPNGITLYHDRFLAHGAGQRLVLVNATGTVISSFDLPVSLGSNFPVMANDGTQFYVYNQNGAGDKVYTVAQDGTVTLVANLPAFTGVTAIGVDPGTQILYYAVGYDSAAIKRWDLANDIAMSDLYEEVGLAGGNGYLGLTGVNEHPGEILVLGDGSVVVHYHDWVLDKDGLLHVSAAGALIWKSEMGTNELVDHLSMGPTAQEIYTWSFVPGPSGGSGWNANYGQFDLLNMTTHSATTVLETPLASAGSNTYGTGSSASATIWTPSSSCFISTLGYSNPFSEVEEPPPTDYPITLGTNGTTPECCDRTTSPTTIPPVDEEYPEIIFACTGGGLPDTVADLPAREVW